MAATAAAASSFSTSMHSLKCTSSKSWPNDHLLKVSCPRTLQTLSVSHSLGTDLNLISGGVCNKLRVLRIAAAVAQEEAAVTAPAPAEEEEEVSGDGAAAAESGGPNTKLYFGNLPYHCDSAQLAGIIQEYASPELIEVRTCTLNCNFS